MQLKIVSIRNLPGFISEVCLGFEADMLQYRAGQYLNLIDSKGVEHPYSIANAPGRGNHLYLYIRHIPNDAITNALIAEILRRQTIEAQGPFGECVFPIESTQPVIFIVGGVGITQIKAMLEQAAMDNDQRSMHLYWGVKELQDCFCPELLMRWKGELADFEYTVVLADSLRAPAWQGKTGKVYEWVTQEHVDLSERQIYLSGPWSLIDDAVTHLKSHGAQQQNLHADRFLFMTL